MKVRDQAMKDSVYTEVYGNPHGIPDSEVFGPITALFVQARALAGEVVVEISEGGYSDGKGSV